MQTLVGRIYRTSSRRCPSEKDFPTRRRLDCGYTACLQLIMTKKLIRHGNSAALVLDKALLELLNVQMNTPLEVTTDGKNIIISPQVNQKAESTLLEALERINRKHGTVLAKLAK